jgi:peptidoglycan/LPS O-acetylase OafA/YrhL
MKFAQTPLNYMPQLDGIRVIAVTLVFCSHWLPQDSLIHAFPLGRIGVDIFFVLSGFLITKILLKERFNADSYILSASGCYLYFQYGRCPGFYRVVRYLHDQHLFV